MKVVVSKYVVFLDKEFILREASGSKVDLEEVQETTNIDQLDEPIVELVFDEVQIGNGEPSIPEDIAALCKSSRVIRPPRRYDLMITKNTLLIEEDEPTTYGESNSNVDSKR
ncbi:hypothetical protein Adt_30874 [Abeliophyllum distichum]|uniref:Uncharacterized protein n=1 Tax=Abeliophyllum distichum TaxID=126358 RepID=A0ABD1RCM5_9LAMI